MPAGEERALSYLLSSHHLNDTDMDRAADRVRAGERPSPPQDLMEIARGELTASRAAGDDPLPHDPGMSSEEKALVFFGSLIFTPLVALAGWWGWRELRPRASREALWMFVPVTLFTTTVWLVVALR